MPASLNVTLEKKSKQDLLTQNETLTNSIEYWQGKNPNVNAQKMQQK